MKKLITLFTALFLFATAQAQDSQGQDFWIAFPGNLSVPTMPLYITGSTNTTGTVSIPGLAFTQNFTVTAGAITTVNLPSGANITSVDAVVNLGVHITALADITVYGFSVYPFTTDAFLAFPTDAIGMDYTLLAYKNVDIVNATQFAIVAAEAGTTTVTITPSVTTGIRTAGVPYNITLTQGQAYMLRNTGSSPNDLTGTQITGDKKISVFGSHQCANIPSGTVYACDFIIEQLPPNSAWGTTFGTVPLASRTGGDTYRVLAQQANTVVSIDGIVVATLNAGQYYESIRPGYNYITATKPVLVGQYSNGTTYDDQLYGDPFFLLVPPTDQFLVNYTVNTGTPNMVVNFINIIAPTAQIAGVTVDAVAIPAGNWTPITGTTFSGTQVSIGPGIGQHSVNSTFPIGVFVYGFGAADSYGYLGGQSFSPVATVSQLSLNLTQTTATQAQEKCVIATVLDQNNNPVVGVLVNFTVSGANAGASGFGITNAQGQVTLCYNVCLSGTDILTATIAGLSAQVTIVVAPSSLAVNPGALNASAGVQSCVTATVLDGSNVPVPNAIVSFTITGTNAAAAVNVATNAQGEAQFCYTPAISGSDVINVAAGCTGGNTATVNVTVGGGGPCPPGPTITLTSGGLNALWVNAGASAPNTFYYGVTNALRINATIVGGAGPYTYAWTSTGGAGTLMPRAYYPLTSIDLFEPTGPVTVTLTITDANNCSYSGSINMAWSNVFYCNHLTQKPFTWYLNMCQGGQTVCVPWATARLMLRNNTGTLGPCPTPKTDLVSQATSFSVYPNPSSGLFTIEMPIAANTSGTVTVMDVNGRALYAETLTMQEGMLYHSIDLSALPNGIYVVRVATENEFATERIQIIR